jgi:hypothetical protein
MWGCLVGVMLDCQRCSIESSGPCFFNTWTGDNLLNLDWSVSFNKSDERQCGVPVQSQISQDDVTFRDEVVLAENLGMPAESQHFDLPMASNNRR